MLCLIQVKTAHSCIMYDYQMNGRLPTVRGGSVNVMLDLGEKFKRCGVLHGWCPVYSYSKYHSV